MKNIIVALAITFIFTVQALAGTSPSTPITVTPVVAPTKVEEKTPIVKKVKKSKKVKAVKVDEKGSVIKKEDPKPVKP